jgi:hypothetical protein
MPLETGPGRAKFEENLKTELAAGKPEDQALAIAYAKQRGDEQIMPPPMLPPSPVNPMFQAVMAMEALNARADSFLAKVDKK